MDTLEGLNEAQRKAVTTTEGFVRVIAGAGSGKTRALTQRFAFLVNELGILPSHILCVTFTNKAAGEMRERIRCLTGDNGTGRIGTFHGFCVSVLSEDSHAVQYPKHFIVLDNTDIDDMLRDIYAERGLTLRDMTFADARDMIELRKLFKEPEYFKSMIAMPAEELRENYMEASEPEDIIFYGYLYREKKCFGLDYNDLIKFTLYIFETSPDIRRKWQERLEYIMIDEFQDIDTLQYELMEVLAAHHGNLFVVGDPDQTIYTWRGANVRFLLDFDKKFPGTKTIMMMENYRSTPEVLAAANALIDKNEDRMKKSLEAVRPSGAKVLCSLFESREKEAAGLAEAAEALHAAGTAYKDMTVLYRAHYMTRTLEEALDRRKIPYAIYSGVRFFDRKEVKDTLSYLRLLVSEDDLSFRRIVNRPRRNIGKSRMAELESYAASHGTTLFRALSELAESASFRRTRAADFLRLIEEGRENAERLPVSEVLTKVLDASGYEEMLRTEGAQERLDDLAELKQSVLDYELHSGEEASLSGYLAAAALFTNGDLEDRRDRMKLMTVHAAKGLEFPFIFLCGMNEGRFPSRKVLSADAMEEERRLAFVAVTRAEDGILFTGCDGRGADGFLDYPSRFLLDMGEAVTYTEPPREGLLRQREEYARKLARAAGGSEYFEEGCRIRHSVFGAGTVTGVLRDTGAYRIRFDSMETERVISFRVPLVKE